MTGEMACQGCHRPLNTTGEPDHPRYIHPPHLGDLGHQPQPVAAASLDTLKRWCDFCGDHYPIWALHGGQVNTLVVGPTGGLVNWGETWAACTACEALIAADDLAGLVDRASAALGLRDPTGRHQIAQLHAAFAHHRRPGRTLVTTTAWPTTAHTAADLPKIRDRLTGLYRGPDRLPEPLDHRRLRQAAADGLEQARLYWIDPQFSDLAGHAAAQLPPTTIDPQDPPSAHGLILWARPVHAATITAASWTTQPGGTLLLVTYRTIGAGLAGAAIQRLREQVGWLAPLRATTAAPGHNLPAGGHPATLIATWLLIAQQATETIPAQLDRKLHKAYARQHRPAPEVRIVRLKPRPTNRPAGSGTGQRVRAPLREREWVGEHWKQQPYGPGRAGRRLIYIAPYLRGPHGTPIRASSTVRVLGTTRPRPSTEQEPASPDG